jgi:YHS domain-containing protein
MSTERDVLDRLNRLAIRHYVTGSWALSAAATEEHEGRTFYFCSKGCHDTFVNDPHRYGHPHDEHAGGHGGHAGH